MYNMYLHVVSYQYDENERTFTIEYDNGAIVCYCGVPKHMAQTINIKGIDKDRYIRDTFHGWNKDKTIYVKNAEQSFRLL